MNSLVYKPRPIPDKSASLEEQKRFQEETKQIVALKEGYTILCEDEAAAQRWSRGGYGWRPKGGDDTVRTMFSKDTVKMFGVLGEDGYQIRIVDTLNADTFIDTLKSLRELYTKFALVLDNAAYHKSGKVDKFIESAGGDIMLIHRS